MTSETYCPAIVGLLVIVAIIGPLAQSRSLKKSQYALARAPSGRETNQRSWPKLYAIFPGGWNGGGGMVHMFNLAMHRRAADWYVQSFYKSHGCRPVGEHSFEVTYGRGEGFIVQTPIGDSHGIRRLTIKFVMVEEKDRADFEGTDLRYEVKT